MNYLLYLYFVMVGVFLTYVGFIWVKYGVLPSISDSWYKLPDNQKFLFTLFCWGFSIPAIIIGLTLSDGNPFQFLIFLGGGGIMFVGASPDFKKKNGMDRKVHYVGALTGVVANTLFLLLVFPSMWYVPTTFITLSTIIYVYKKKVDEIWWIEILSFSTYAGITGVVLNKVLELM